MYFRSLVGKNANKKVFIVATKRREKHGEEVVQASNAINFGHHDFV